MKPIKYLSALAATFVLAFSTSVTAMELYGYYQIKSTFGCDTGHPMCNADLSWSAGGEYPFATLNSEDPVVWEVVPLDDVPGGYLIKNSYGCDSDGYWCNAELSWDYSEPYPNATVEHDDPVIWEITPVEGVENGYRIRNLFGCDTQNEWCNAELSWDNADPHPVVTLEHNDPVVWSITPDVSEEVSRLRYLLNDSFGHSEISDLTIDPTGGICSVKSECNNLRYEGFCSNGNCESIYRGSCDSPGRVELCVKNVGPDSFIGVRICKPDYLKDSYWGDCERKPEWLGAFNWPDVDNLRYTMDNKTTEQISTLTIDPNGAVCSADSECNNLYYEGHCHLNRCQSMARESCSVGGTVGVCLSQHGAFCTGARKCNPDYLGEEYWGDCEC